MAIIRVKPTRVEEIFISEEPIGHLATVYISGDRRVREGETPYQERGVGAVVAQVLSGKLTRVVTHGIVSGLICASAINAGDRVTIASTSGTGLTSGLASGKGKITPFNTITPDGSISRVSGFLRAISGTFTSAAISGMLGIDGTSLALHQRLLSGIDGFQGAAPTFTGTAYNTGRVLGRALQSGGCGSGIQVMVDKGG